LATNSVQFLSQTNEIILLDKGEIRAKDSYENLMNNSKDFKEFMSAFLMQQSEKSSSDMLIQNSETKNE
jgi:hypothetical protein